MIEYVCQCINHDGDITYQATRNTLKEAENMVSHYMGLIACNGEAGIHKHIEIAKNICDDDGEPIKTIVLERHPV